MLYVQCVENLKSKTNKATPPPLKPSGVSVSASVYRCGCVYVCLGVWVHRCVRVYLSAFASVPRERFERMGTDRNTVLR